MTSVRTLLGMAIFWFVPMAFATDDLPVTSVVYPGTFPGSATAEIAGNSASLENNVLRAEYHWGNDGLCLSFQGLDPQTGVVRGTASPTVKLGDGRILSSANFHVKGDVERSAIAPKPEAHRLGERFAGWELRFPLYSGDASVELTLVARLRDGSNYVTHNISLSAPKTDLPIDTLTLLELEAVSAKVLGSTQGAPVTAGQLFFAIESPFAEGRVEESRVLCTMQRGNTLKAGTPLRASCVMAVTPPGQLRRGFLYYLERERAHPYRPFLHYNSWYDIAWGDRKFNEAQSLEAIELFGENLYVKRGLPLQSFVFDDGWDDNKTLWQFHEGFPNGFTPLREKAARYGSAIGTWLSPFGGYGEAREQRLAYGRAQGYETNKSGFSMAGPVYYDRYKAICEEMIRAYGVNFFKFDGMGAGLGAGVPGSREFLNDLDALMRLSGELRALNPGLYISATTGTWPSPYFLWHADNIWRGAQDMGFSGKGSKRRQWINYRDTWTYKNIVLQGPLYPLNALMTQGIVHAIHGPAGELGTDLTEFSEEVWSFFGSGTSLQELYIAPTLMTGPQWDILAEGAKWARANASILVDTHWVGGDPGDDTVYGWAAWSPEKSILVLRNPAEHDGAITLDVAQVLELPQDAPLKYSLSTPRSSQAAPPVKTLHAGTSQTFNFRPFEVLVFELAPET